MKVLKNGRYILSDNDVSIWWCLRYPHEAMALGHYGEIEVSEGYLPKKLKLEINKN